jgi:hypothetical protein
MTDCLPPCTDGLIGYGSKDGASPTRFPSINTTTSRLYCADSATWGYFTPRCTVIEAKKKKEGNKRGAMS